MPYSTELMGESSVKSSYNVVNLSRLHRFVAIFLLLCIAIATTRLILLLTNFPWNHAIGDLLVNEGWLTPNNDLSEGHVRLRSINVTILGVGRDIADTLPGVLKQVQLITNYSLV